MWMQERLSLNLEPLRALHTDPATMGAYGEAYAYSDPEGALVKLRSFAERILDHASVYTEGLSGAFGNESLLKEPGGLIHSFGSPISPGQEGIS